MNTRPKFPTWRGVRGSKFIWHGEWSDPEVIYKRKRIDNYDLEEGCWDQYKRDCKKRGEEATPEGYDNLPASWFKEYLDYIYMPCVFYGGL